MGIFLDVSTLLLQVREKAASERKHKHTHTHTHVQRMMNARNFLVALVALSACFVVEASSTRSLMQGPLAGIDITNLDPEIIQSAGAGFVNEFLSDYFCSNGTSPGELTNTLSGFGGGSGGPISLLATFFALGAEQAWNGAANVIQAGNAGNPIGAAVSGCRR